MEIQVNGRFHHIEKRTLTYTDVVGIAGCLGFDHVEVRWRPYEARAAAKGGELKPGESVTAAPDMVFFVRRRL
jgi:hypothetical protein